MAIRKNIMFDNIVQATTRHFSSFSHKREASCSGPCIALLISGWVLVNYWCFVGRRIWPTEVSRFFLPYCWAHTISKCTVVCESSSCLPESFVPPVLLKSSSCFLRWDVGGETVPLKCCLVNNQSLKNMFARGFVWSLIFYFSSGSHLLVAMQIGTFLLMTESKMRIVKNCCRKLD